MAIQVLIELYLTAGEDALAAVDEAGAGARPRSRHRAPKPTSDSKGSRARRGLEALHVQGGLVEAGEANW